MTTFSILGAGSMASSIATVALKGGATVQVLARDPQNSAAAVAALGSGATSARFGDALTGDVVVLALPYGAVADVVGQYATQLDGKVVVDITNPLDFTTFDDLSVASGTSAAQQIAALVPGARVLKAFNMNFAATLATGKVGGATTTVLVAGDDVDAKATLIGVVEAAGLGAVDAGSLKRAQQLEALGFLQLTLAVGEKIAWTGGFSLAR
ncbi:MAG TPA: NADPH-dependent F420 reductase [Cellulomonas sp.]|uniref:NADPH-dependent F420 reductase n=1 Tax=Cellulomonas sp. TaxID=40001 RepID=UPI002E30AD67|nr:NADPH-dependent F420 reductase [Cellulomonas sp.]HEX5333710.1 NADPH-dependent F420 reductase [Cellulomonas sp.]